MNECVINSGVRDKVSSHKLPGALSPIHECPAYDKF
jgi:hypothetical protein